VDRFDRVQLPYSELSERGFALLDIDFPAARIPASEKVVGVGQPSG